MNLTIDYKNLYQHWLKEFQTPDLTELSDDILNKYKEFVKSIDSYEIKKNEKIKNEILEEYNKNLNYLIEDFLKIRKIKIINNALSLREVNLNFLFEAEKLLYQNLVASTKGYEKVKSLSSYKNVEKVKFEEKESYSNETDITREKNIISHDNNITILSENKSIEISEKIDYKLIRFIEDTPPLVGIDLINYGPFKKEDIANLPFQNAKILVNEKFAELIDIS